MRSSVSRRLGALTGALVLCGLASCARRLPPLTGVPASAVLPSTEIPPIHRHVVFRWQLDDLDFSSRGEGAARIAGPDSARLDFFLAGGLGSGAAVLIGDDLRLPSQGDELARRVVPPPPLLWGALGRVALPAVADTVARVDVDTLRVDIGKPVVWRLTFFRDTLRRLERVDAGRVIEWVDRSADGRVRYRNQASRRQLELIITRSQDVGAFDRSIWIFP